MSDESEMPFLLAAAAFERLADIDDALARIATSEFGRCDACGSDIPYRRLRALPTATTCRPCSRPADERNPTKANLIERGNLQ